MDEFERAKWADVLTALAVFAIVAIALSGCSSCKVIYAYDGGVTAKPYYKVRICDGKKPVVECDSPTRLPTALCR